MHAASILQTLTSALTMSFQYANFPQNATLPVPDSSGAFTITASVPTDIWRRPTQEGILDSFNAPIVYKSIPISQFQSARVTITGKWTTLYDQGGLIVVFPSTKSRPVTEKRWLKTGIEFYQGRPMASTVATDLFSDWSLVPLDPEDEREGRMTVEVEREQEEDGRFGSVLRVLLVGRDGKGVPVREVTWAFYDVDEEEEMWVGMLAAKPTQGGAEELEVRLEGFEIKLRD
ncbi:hypothetical protein HYALB_00007375 [Hymenoscyphus albidus]|uniref:Uncharacterized protein n=1 Tax=Hymenoscyphus albidus TaxID=595503 RepID=A0A9N9LKI5_9HELO|nr:hypothetical protein HYALB_00007375 [Hymenoscyphus albidus]